MNKKKMKLTIGWLFPEFMSTYGDRGNVITLNKRAEWRGIETTILPLSSKMALDQFSEVDLIVGGGAQNREQEIVNEKLNGKLGEKVLEKIERKVPALLICASLQLFGQSVELPEGKILRGLGFFPCKTSIKEENRKRFAGDLVFKLTAKRLLEELNLNSQESGWILGFENHSGRTFIDRGEALGEVIIGDGNNGQDKTEGIFHKNVIGSYAHGPFLPKNPFLADWLIKTALEHKYQEEIELSPLTDIHAMQARNDLLKRFGLF